MRMYLIIRIMYVGVASRRADRCQATSSRSHKVVDGSSPTPRPRDGGSCPQDKGWKLVLVDEKDCRGRRRCAFCRRDLYRERCAPGAVLDARLGIPRTGPEKLDIQPCDQNLALGELCEGDGEARARVDIKSTARRPRSDHKRSRG